MNTFILDLSYISLFWLIAFLFQVIGFGWLWQANAKFLLDRGWGFARVVAWLLIGLPIWLLAYLKLPINNTVGVWLVLILNLILVINLLVLKKQLAHLLLFVSKHRSLLLFEELLFSFGLFFMSITRGFAPDIFDLEKFMDAGFMVAYSKSSQLPALDMWFAGESLNYYTFGHFLGSLWLQLSNLKIEYVYNILLGWLMGLMLIEAFSLIVSLVRYSNVEKDNNFNLKIAVLAGLIGAILLVFSGNTHTFWYWLNHANQKTSGSLLQAMSGYWYPDATRFIYHTIHEFPAYSFVVSDLHAHLWNVPMTILMLMMIWWWLELALSNVSIFESLQYKFLLFLLGILMGVLLMTNAWDLAIYGLFLIIVGVVILFTNFSLFSQLAFSALLVVLGFVSSASLWFMSFDSISEGLAWVTSRSPVRDLAILWTLHFLTTGIAFVFALDMWLLSKSKNRSYLFIIIVIIVAWLLILIPELVYVKDIYKDHPRANTMFKLTFQSFIMMSIVMGWLWGFVNKPAQFDWFLKWLMNSFLVFVFGFLLFYSYFSYQTYYSRFSTYRGLDGLQWLRNSFPDYYQALNWLRGSNQDSQVIVEAVGDSYTEFNHLSAFSGFQTIVGWRVHEWLWRGGYDQVGKRSSEVETIYNEPLSVESFNILKKYKPKYIIVGELEYKNYPNLNYQELMNLGKVVFRSGRLSVIELNSFE